MKTDQGRSQTPLDAAHPRGSSRRPSTAKRIGTGLAGLLYAALLAGPPDAGAATIFIFTGEGLIRTFNPNGSTASSLTASLTGTVSVDVYGMPDRSGPGFAIGDNTWVSTFYQLSWTGATSGQFDSSPVLGATFVRDSASVFDNFDSGGRFPPPLFDQVQLENQSERVLERSTDVKNVTIFRYTTQTDWLSGLAFPETAGLAPPGIDPADTRNTLAFYEYHFARDPNGVSTFLPGSYFAAFSLTSMTMASPVPEPGTLTLALVGLGLAALGWRTRQESRAKEF